jgi:Uma2 family endonuclease
VATSTTRLITFAEFEQLPNPQFGRYELRRGEPVIVAPPKLKHSTVLRRLRRLLEAAAGETGIVDSEFGFRPLPEGEFRIADVVFISQARWQGIDLNGYFEGAPELVAEILSPSNTKAEILDKKKLCLENGAREFWVVDIDHRKVEISTPDGRTITYKSGQQIPLFFAAGALNVDAIFA